MTFSQQQQDIFNWVKEGSGNLIIKARAGSGKTSTAVNAIQYMKGSVLAMAFNNKASYQLKEKLANMGLPNATASTVHSAGKNLLYKSQGWHKVDGSKVFWITDKYCKGDLAFTRNFIAKLVSFAKQSAFGVAGQPPAPHLTAPSNQFLTEPPPVLIDTPEGVCYIFPFPHYYQQKNH